MCKHRFGVELLQNPPLCSSTAPLYSGPTAPIMNFHNVPETVTQGPGDPLSIEVPLRPFMNFSLCRRNCDPRTRRPTFYSGPTAPIYEFSHCPRNCDPMTRRPTFYIAVPLRPFMNFYFVAETVTQGQCYPFSKGPTAPIMNFYLVAETVTQGQGDPTSRGPFFAPFLNFHFVPLMLTPQR
jgi:hypothetical protein